MLIVPAASGRVAVRATLRSSRLSHRSFTTHPAARIDTAPTRNNPISHSIAPVSWLAGGITHHPGNSSSHQPIGRSIRATSR